MASEDGYLNESDWFKHSCHPTGDKRFNKLVSKYGAKGYAVFFSALEVIYSGTLDNDEVEGISDTLGMTTEEVSEVLEFCEVECRKLLYRVDGIWTSNRAENELGKRRDKKAKRQVVNHNYWLKKKAENEEEIREAKTVLDNLRDSKTIESLTKTPIRERERERVRVREDIDKETIKNKFFMKESGEVASNSTEKKASRFVSLNPPTLDEVKAYGATLSLPFDAEAFHDHFTSNGWKVSGKAPMKDWKAAARNWARNGVTMYDSKPNRKDAHPERKTHPEVTERELIGFEEGEL